MKIAYYLNTVDDEGNPCRIEIKGNEADPEKQDTPLKHVAFVNQKRKNAGYKNSLKLSETNAENAFELEFSGGKYKET